MKSKNIYEEMLKLGLKSKASRKKTISACSKIIGILNATSNKKLSSEQLGKITAGWQSEDDWDYWCSVR